MSSARRFLFWLFYALALTAWHHFLSNALMAPGAVSIEESVMQAAAVQSHAEPQQKPQRPQEQEQPRPRSQPPRRAQPQQQVVAAASVPIVTTTKTATTNATAREMCKAHKGAVHTEYDGAVMVPGVGSGKTVSASPAECCELCAKTRGCNVWVACTHQWCGSQCWLKWVEDPRKPPVRGSGGDTPWTAGTLPKDSPGDQPVASEAALNSTRIVSLRTKFGELRIRLKPEWHLPSVRYVQAAALGDFCTVKCELYRAEPGFLLQGAMRALIKPNKQCRKFRGGPEECTDSEVRPGGPMMEKGDVAWAGGSAGPDFFIMMTRNGFGSSHTVWGSMADQESMDLALKLVHGKSSSKPGTMRILDEPIGFTMAPTPGA
jgi:hypothetical protein